MQTDNKQDEVFEKKSSSSTKIFLWSFFLVIVVTVLSVGITIGITKTDLLQELSQTLHTTSVSETDKQKTFIPESTGTYDASRELIPSIVKRVYKGVVSIAISDYSLEQGRGPVETQNKIGTGFIINKDGLIVTNRHVVAEDAVYKVITSDNKSYVVKKIIRDPINDIAFVFVDFKNANISPIPLGDSNDLQLGQTVIAIGTPLGELSGSVTVGVISGLHRKVTVGSYFMGQTKEYENVIQTDAAINPGNSGGPLINLGGEVVGVNFAKTSGADNISFALPIDLVKQRLNEYNEYGRLREPFIGIAYVYVSPVQAELYDIVPGAFIKRVVPDSPADKAGLRPGDIIVKLDGKTIENGIPTILYEHKIGDEVEAKVAQIKDNGKVTYKTVKIKIADKAEFIKR